MATYSADKPDPYAPINPRTGQQFGEISCSVPHIPRPIVLKATCDFCGEEVLCSDLDEFNACPDCHQEPKETDRLCSNCNGSGEGMHEGTRCYVCHGKGTVWTEWECLNSNVSEETLNDKLKFWRELNNHAISQRGESARAEFKSEIE